MNNLFKKYGEWALITGASKGIGEEFSRQIATRGLNVALVVRSETLKRSNIDVLSVNPGFTKSNLSPQISFDGLPLKPMSAASVVKTALGDLGSSQLSVPGLIKKFLYYTGKYLQPRRLNTAAFGTVFRLVLRNKLRDLNCNQHPNTSST